MISETQLEWAMEILIDRNSEAAKARAAHEHMADLDKTVLAKLMAQSGLSSASAKEAWARAHPEYEAHLNAKAALAELDYSKRDRRSAASAILEAWRTEQSNARAAAGIDSSPMRRRS